MTQPIRCFESNTVDYHKAFQAFLDHTDEKTKARERLDQLVAELKMRNVYIDAGAGNGQITAWLQGYFQKTIAVEPNDALRAELTRVCPDADISSDMISDAEVTHAGDFILASHVFYYIPAWEWAANLEKLVSWLAPKGTLAVIIQNHESDCMKMLDHFTGRHFNLFPLTNEFKNKNSTEYDARIHTVPSHIHAPNLDTACTIAEFILNLVPLNRPPLMRDVRQYVAKNFQFDTGYRFSCTQDFLEIRRK